MAMQSMNTAPGRNVALAAGKPKRVIAVQTKAVAPTRQTSPVKPGHAVIGGKV